MQCRIWNQYELPCSMDPLKQVTDERNGWPSTYKIPINQNYRIYGCLRELYQSAVDDKYEELNSL